MTTRDLAMLFAGIGVGCVIALAIMASGEVNRRWRDWP